MNSRDVILKNIRQANKNEYELAPSVPFFHNDPKDIIEQFQKSLIAMGGEILQKGQQDPYEFVKEKLKDSQKICSVVPEFKGNFELTSQMLPKTLHDIDYAIVRASFGVAETGSVCLTEQDLFINTLGYLPQHLIVFLDPAQIVENIHDAYARPEWKQIHYGALHSGPSATADIEGVLIRGAQGVRSLSVLLIG